MVKAFPSASCPVLFNSARFSCITYIDFALCRITWQSIKNTRHKKIEDTKSAMLLTHAQVYYLCSKVEFLNVPVLCTYLPCWSISSYFSYFNIDPTRLPVGHATVFRILTCRPCSQSTSSCTSFKMHSHGLSFISHARDFVSTMPDNSAHFTL